MSTEPLDDLNGVLLDGLSFCGKIYALFEAVRSTSDGVERLRNRSGVLEKPLLEELLPICRYVQTYYRAGRYISVRWVNGSQSYDAELHQHGEYIKQGYYSAVGFLEATCAMHENEHWIWKLLNQGHVAYAPEGIVKERGKDVQSAPVVFRNGEHIDHFTRIVVERIKKKSEVGYPDSTSLVVQCHLNSLYIGEDWQRLVSAVEEQLAFVPFKEVLMFDGTTERASSLNLRRA